VSCSVFLVVVLGLSPVSVGTHAGPRYDQPGTNDPGQRTKDQGPRTKDEGRSSEPPPVQVRLKQTLAAPTQIERRYRQESAVGPRVVMAEARAGHIQAARDQAAAERPEQNGQVGQRNSEERPDHSHEHHVAEAQAFLMTQAGEERADAVKQSGPKQAAGYGAQQR